MLYEPSLSTTGERAMSGELASGWTHYTRAVAAVSSVAAALHAGRGTTKQSREDMARKLTTSLVDLRSAVYHDESLSLAEFDQANRTGRQNP